MLNYIKSNLDTFDKNPVNEIDLAVLSWLSYLTLSDYQEINEENEFLLKDVFCAEHFEKMLNTIKSRDESLQILTAAVASPRFRSIRITDYMEKLNDETQFSAVTYHIADDIRYISFRGTDNSFIGWKEDLNLSLVESTIAQDMSVLYVNEAARKYDGNLILGGHSKGGNLAVYAGSQCMEKDRISAIYSFDGPGFSEDEMNREGFREIKDKIIKIVPQSSLIGMLFENECEIKIVNARSVSLGQHNMLTWKISDGEFEYRDELTADSKVMYRALNGFMNSLSYDEREKMINTIFEILEETGVSDFEVLVDNMGDYAHVIIKKYASLDKETRKFLRGCVRKLAENGAKSIPSAILDEIGKNGAD